MFVCSFCGYQVIKKMGRCPGCGQWDSFEEKTLKAKIGPIKGDIVAQPIHTLNGERDSRLTTDLEEFDRVLGGGIVPGSLVLLGGDPGIGKSTLILQVLGNIARKGFKAIYVTGEESLSQLKMRADRLGIREPGLLVMGNQSIEGILCFVEQVLPFCIALDSIQTAYSEENASSPGSLMQLREVTSQVMRVCKDRKVAAFLIGHVTKEGVIAGPKLLEHMVDTVLYLEGEKYQSLRILRGTKNRFGNTQEIGVFEMREEGFWPVKNPSLLFLQERPQDVSGSVVTAYVEGTRPLLVEIQALVSNAGAGIPRRVYQGLEPGRVSIITAILEKRLGLSLGDKDIFLNVAGGLKIQETAADLAIGAAIISSYLDRPLPWDLLLFGEVGLAGEVRSVSNPGARIKEAKKLGFKRAVLPKKNLLELGDKREMYLYGLNDLRELVGLLFRNKGQGLRDRNNGAL